MLGTLAGTPLSRLSDRGPDGTGPGVAPVLGALLGITFLVPAGAALGAAVGVSLRGLDRWGRATPGPGMLAGLVAGSAVPTVLEVLFGVAVDPAAAPAFPPPVIVVPAAVAGLVGAGLGYLMVRSAAVAADDAEPRR